MVARRTSSPNKRGRFRIIGGHWRGRRLGFLDDGSVRPTPDRIRETLFNWLSQDVPQAHCLDLYAGSGALGLEALSRGAGSCCFVDAQAAAISAIRANLQALNCTAECVHASAADYLRNCHAQFSIVFVDPPYAQDLVVPTLQLLAPRLGARNRVYLECEAGMEPSLPGSWTVLKSRRAGQVGYHLLTHSAEPGD